MATAAAARRRDALNERRQASVARSYELVTTTQRHLSSGSLERLYRQLCIICRCIFGCSTMNVASLLLSSGAVGHCRVVVEPMHPSKREGCRSGFAFSSATFLLGLCTWVPAVERSYRTTARPAVPSESELRSTSSLCSFDSHNR